MIHQPNESCRKLINLIETNAKRGANIVKQILVFSRSEEGERHNLKLNNVIEEVKDLIQETFPKTINVVVNTPPDLWTVYANPTQIHQVLLNLCVNSRDAMPQGGTLMICAENRVVEQDYARKHLNVNVGAYVVLSIIDTGYGIPPQILERIFEPFFTTKELYKGTGLGLFTAIGIVKSHGGFIGVSSELKCGTQFEIFLPAIEVGKIESKVVAELPLPEGKGELILVVDDEKDNLYMTQVLIETAGYQVITAKDGLEASAIFEQQHSEIELVLMDMMMPNLDGLGAIAELVKIAPQIKIIGLSGLVTDSLAKNSKVKAFLSKPITAESLLTTIKQVIQN